MTDDPLLAPWVGAHGGFPRFDRIQIADFKPAIAKAMDLFRAELAAITSTKAAPTFANTIAALEAGGRPLARATNLYGVYRSTMNSKAMQAVETELSPILAAFNDELVQNEALFARIKAVYDGRAAAKLAPDQLRLTELTYSQLARQGAALGAADKAQLKQLNAKLASLYTKFSQNELADEEDDRIVVEHDAELAGVPDTLKAQLAAAAEAKQLAGKWLIANTRSAVVPVLTYASHRELRERAWKMWTHRGDHAGPRDNKPVITEILQLRARRAKLLGFPSHAHWTLADNMARTPEAARALMMKVWAAAVERAKEEIADMQKLADAERAGFRIAAWDYRYYAEKVRRARYDLDQNEVKQYLQLDKLRDAMMWAAGQLYGLAFAPIHGVPTCHPDVTVYEVTRAGKLVGLWYFDPYAREGKQSGAWMSEYRTQEAATGAVTPIVSNNSNFVKGKDAILISWDDAVTLFHEFGHALHGLNSEVRYAALAGTNVKRDFVEFPSQLNEHWLTTPEVLGKFAVHYQTGKPIPAELVAKLQRAKHFNAGFRTVEYLASALYDLDIHSQPAEPAIDPAAFEQRTLTALGCPPEIAMRHRPPHFGHIFSGDEYSAGYYAYIWADTLTADAAEAFQQAGSFYDKATAKRLHDAIMCAGNGAPPEAAFRAFRGRDVDTNALMRDRGFPVH